MIIRNRFLRVIIVSLLLLILLITWANYRVINKSEPFIYTDINKVPFVQTGLLLGTSKLLKNGNTNQYFKHRINAAVDLYKSGKIKYLIISGDNSRPNYNEPLDMKNELMQAGIPDSVIYLDYAGFRTFDSVIRANKIFGQNKLISISQKFHNERTVFIARNYDIEAYGYNAKDVNAYMGFKTNLREIFARFKVFIDILIDKEPKFLGEKIKIGS